MMRIIIHKVYGKCLGAACIDGQRSIIIIITIIIITIIIIIIPEWGNIIIHVRLVSDHELPIAFHLSKPSLWLAHGAGRAPAVCRHGAPKR